MRNWLGIIGVLLPLGMLTQSCTANQRIINSAAESTPVSNVEPAVNNFEHDLQSMRNADFKFILVFRRKDGTILTPDDKAFANANTPFDANRRRLSDEGKAIIIGTNFPFAPGMPEILAERFTMENYSKPDSGPIVAKTTPNR